MLLEEHFACHLGTHRRGRLDLGSCATSRIVIVIRGDSGAGQTHRKEISFLALGLIWMVNTAARGEFTM